MPTHPNSGRISRTRRQRRELSPEALERRLCLAASVSVSLADSIVMEGEAHRATIQLSEPLTETERVVVTLADGTASYGRDYFGMLTQQVTFRPGQTAKTITIRTLRDSSVEGQETFRITAAPVNPQIRGGSAVAGIIEYSPLESVTVEPASVVEGASDSTTTATFLITLSGPSQRPVTVTYETRDDSATAGSGDYSPSAGEVVFQPGETSKTVGVQVIGDDVQEGDEVFEFVLTDVSGGRITQSVASGTIFDDDSPEDVNLPGFQITLEYLPSPFGEVPDAVRDIAQAAANRWSEIIVGDLPLVEEGGILIDDLRFSFRMGLLGGEQNSPRGALANARPVAYRNGQTGLPYLAETGIDPFDAEVQSAAGRQALFDTILHEMGHGLGFTPGSNVFGRFIDVGDAAYVGPNALAAYNSIFGFNATGVPLEPDTLAHWDEFVFTSELMTPNIGPGTAEISRITVGALEDMGYEVNYGAADFYRPFNAVTAPPDSPDAVDVTDPPVAPPAEPADPPPTTVRPPVEPPATPVQPPRWNVDLLTRKLPPAPWRPAGGSSEPVAAASLFGPTFRHLAAARQASFASLSSQISVAAAFQAAADALTSDADAAPTNASRLFALAGRS